MIRLATREDQDAILALCARDPWNGTEVMTACLSLCADHRNVDWRYCDIWIGASESRLHAPQYLLCRIGGSYRMVGAPHSPARREELQQFLSLQLPGKLIARSEDLEEFAACCPGQELSAPAPQMLCCSRLGPCGEEDDRIQSCQSLWSLYEVLADADEAFRDISQDELTARLRFLQRGGAQFFELREQGRVVSVGGILMPEPSEYGLIVDLCTRRESRGKGYAARMVDRLCSEAFLQGKIPALLCGNRSLAAYYERMGFEQEGSWRSLCLETAQQLPQEEKENLDQ